MTRRVWTYTEGDKPLPEPIEVGEDFRNVLDRTGDGLKFEFNNLRATDGTDISSKTKHDRYMREKGLALASDFQGEWAKAYEERQAYRRGEKVDPGHRWAIGKAEYELSKRKGKR